MAPENPLGFMPAGMTVSVDLYQRVVRPILFRLDAERAHHWTVEASRLAGRMPWLAQRLRSRLQFDDPSLASDVAGLSFGNPIGLAAGWDKSGRALSLLPSLGFGFVEIGSVSSRPSLGNSKPRLFRLAQDRAIVVNYGLPNDGCEVVAQRVKNYQGPIPLGVNLVKTNDGPGAPACSADEIFQDYLTSVQHLAPHASYLALNLSCPNAEGGKDFFAIQGTMTTLLDHLSSEPLGCPVFLKLAPDPSPASIERVIAEADPYPFVKGMIFNLPPGKPETIRLTTDSSALARMPGAVAGHPTADLLSRCVGEMYQRMPRGRFALIGGGGVFSAQDAYQRIRLGASLVQIYTALIYEGPAVVRHINQGLTELLRRDGLANISAAIGTAHAS